MSLTTFFSRIHLANNKLSFWDICKAGLVCLFEIVILRTILMVARLTTFFGYKKKRMRWDKINRTELNL